MNRRTLFCIILLLVLGFSVYANSLRGVLFWDDEITVINNVFLRKPLFYLKDIFLSTYHSGSGDTLNFYRPLATLSFALDYRLWKLNALGYHLSNVILHLLSGVFLFLLLERIFNKLPLSVLTAVLFLVHPINSEAVNYVSNRTDPLMLFFFLVSFYLYVAYRQKGNKYFLVSSVITYILCILSKEMGLILPLFLLAYELIIRDDLKTKSKGRGIKRLIPLINFAVVFIVYVALRSTLLNFLNINLLTQGAQKEPFSHDLIIRFLTHAKAGLIYLRLFFWPTNLHMEYDMPIVLSRIDMLGWLALISLILLAGLIFYLGRNNKKIIFAASWFIIGVLPVSGIIPINNVVSEHYLYLATGGFFLLLSLVFLRLLSIAKMRILTGIFLIILIIILSTLTILRNRDWHEPLRMYLEIISQTKQSFRAHNNAGVEYFRSGDLIKAEQYFRSSLEIQPTYAPAINNLGVIYRRRDDIAEAERLYKAAIQADPDYLLAHENLLGIYFTQNRIDEAKKELDRILEIHPHHPQAKELLNQLRDN